jgi:hypothetical protein
LWLIPLLGAIGAAIAGAIALASLSLGLFALVIAPWLMSRPTSQAKC